MDDIKICDKILSLDQVRQIAQETFGDMAKAVIDIERGIVAVGGELHADAEQLLLEQGSKQENLWGINLYPDNSKEEFIEFHSLINIRPSAGNRSQGIEDKTIQDRIRQIIFSMLKEDT